ncbi:MAG: (NiFe) hydrogenase maturation protein HypF [Eubacterium sp.]|nr:(NiFe) hydrogenase maturation protein HypF [Eubacterium sp.]
MIRYKITITGIVQGVGFRPFIFNLAKRMDFSGWVGNTDSDVIVELETNKTQLSVFIETIKTQAPVLSKIETISYEEMETVGFTDFTIRESESLTKGHIYISPDVGTCQNCLREMYDSRDRRYGYPFINCTNCGPRFTIIKDIPYDREKTTMSCFEMCEQCRKEYTNPSDRRYHAQPVSCHECGPVLQIADETGKFLSGGQDTVQHTKELAPHYHEQANSQQCISYITDIIRAGKIAAIKGIGGYHLACNALNESAVKRLRSRKHRDDKPFALMMKNLEVVERFCHVTDKEKELLQAATCPIVLLEKKIHIALPDEIANLNRYLGVMLPYTPIHYLLFEQEAFPEVLVMTSGNLSSEPIFYGDKEAMEGLVGIADAFLTNNREIYIRTDDSVTRVFNEQEYIIRRSRGYVPIPLKLELQKLLQIDSTVKIPSVLACGGELKNVFCLNKGNMFYMSHHIGDLENESTNKAYVNAVEHFKKLFDINPEQIAYDLHPNYFSTQYALEQGFEDKTGVQHHKAHIASCMAENGLSGEVIGVSFDGTGYGEDGKIWGGEFFKGGYYGFERSGRLQYVMMPGSDSAVKHPWKMALSHLFSAGLLNAVAADDETCRRNGGPIGETRQDCRILSGISSGDIAFTLRMLERKLNCPETSSMGRFFDAVSALLGIKTDISYEGQAAIELEYFARLKGAKPYEAALEFDETGGFVVRTDSIIHQLLEDIQRKKGLELIASSFHSTISEIILAGCSEIRKSSKLNRVVLSGGVFQNITLLGMSFELLKKNGFEVYTHSRVPANDGGIALGQAIMSIANSVSKT